MYLVAHERRDAALRLHEAVFAALDGLASEGVDGPRSTLRTGEEVRSWSLHPFKMRLYYARGPEVLWVVRVYHASRAPIAR